VENLYSLAVIVSSACHLCILGPVKRFGSDHHQLSLILDTLGTPSIDDFYAINSTRSREYIKALPFRRKKIFLSLFPNANPLVSVSTQQVPNWH
jgi:hypothetical protein